MALTNFAKLTDEQKTVWSKQMWRAARNYSFVDKFTGTGPNSIIQRITELKKSEKGARAVITLLADLQGDGIAGDRTLEGNEEAMRSFDQVIRIDQLRHANRLEGRVADQKSIVTFRENSRDMLGYWLGDRIDQMAFLTLSGVSYEKTNNGADRVGSDLPFLEFATDVRPPTSARMARWNGTSKQLEVGQGTGNLVAADKISWDMIVQARAYMKDQYIRDQKSTDGLDTLVCFMTPQVMANMKLDPTYMANVRGAAQRNSKTNPLFGGNAVEVDGVLLVDFRHVYNTSQAPTGSKWGGSGDINGCQVLLCGAQALGIADIGNAYWEEKDFDYANQAGVSVGKIFGLLKPQFNSIYSNNTVQDFGVMSIYVSQGY